MTARRMPPRRGVSAAVTVVTADATTTARASTMSWTWYRRIPAAISDLPSVGGRSIVFCYRLVADGTVRRGTCQLVLPVRLLVRWSGHDSVLGQPDVLQLLVRLMVPRRHVVPHLRPVHDAARPPEPRDVLRVLEDDLLDLVHEPLALGGIERSCLTREQIVDSRIGETPPVVGVPGRVALEKQVGVVHVVEDAVDDDLEIPGVPTVREPGRRLERPVLGLDPDLAPLLDHEHPEV